MSPRLMILSLMFVAAVTGLGNTVEAQPRARVRPDLAPPVPQELVIALLGAGRVTDQPAPEILIRKWPDNFPPELLPSGSVEILGGLRTFLVPGAPGSRTTAIGIIASNPDSILSALYARWERAGWRHPTRGQPPGFVSGPAPMTRPVVYCTDSAYLTASAAPRPAGGTYLRIDLAIGQPMNSCSAEAMRPRMPDEIPFPTLVAPAGTTSSNGYMGGSTFGREASTLLETDITPAGLISHYSTQLKAAGWTVRESTGSITSAVIQIVEMKNSKGHLLTGILTAVALSKPRTRDVSFKILSPDSPRFFQ